VFIDFISENQIKQNQNSKQVKNHYIKIREVIHKEIKEEKYSVVDIKGQYQTIHSYFRNQFILYFLLGERMNNTRDYYN
jgi:hypothetical protein